jgi:hypothetical protein
MHHSPPDIVGYHLDEERQRCSIGQLDVMRPVLDQKLTPWPSVDITLQSCGNASLYLDSEKSLTW